MRQDELQKVFARADEALRSLEKEPEARQFFGDLMAFVRNVTPLMAELQVSIEDTAKQLPAASQQLDKVTTAHELASTEILDIVERILRRVGELEEGFAKKPTAGAHARQMAEAVEQVARRYPADEEVTRLVKTWEDILAGSTDADGKDGRKEIIETIKAECTSIMIALQVQDITAQQIAGVNHLMQSVDDGLNALLRHVRGEECAAEAGRDNRRPPATAFDPAAEYDTSTARQQAADFIVSNAHQQGS